MNNLLKRVDEELQFCKSFNPIMAFGMLEVRKMIAEECQGVIHFRKINGLKPTFQSCTLKVYEEYGELASELGKGQKLSGERQDISHVDWVYRVISESLDGVQSLVTLIHLLAEENNIDIQGEIDKHEKKLREKGYLVTRERPVETHLPGSDDDLHKYETKCKQCAYGIMTKEELEKLEADPCETCGIDCRNWKPKEGQVG